MTSKRGKLLCALVILMLAGIYNLVLFQVKQVFVPVSWLAYGLTMFPFAVMLLDVCAFKDKRLDYLIFELPIMRVSFIYALVQLAYGALILAFNQFNFVFACVSEAFLLALYIIRWASLSLVKEYAANQDNRSRQKRAYIQSLVITLNAVEALASDADLRKRVAKFKEAVSFSDPMSHPSLAFIEERIEKSVDALNDDVTLGNAENAIATLNTLNRLLAERNDRCLSLK